MSDILLATIPAALVLVATLGARFIEHYLQGKRETGRQKLEREREIREARRKDRESIVLPIREALMEIQTKLVMRSMLEFVRKGDEKGRPYSVDQASMEQLREVVTQSEDADRIETFTKRVPLVYQISNQETREFLESLIIRFAVLKQKEKDKLTIEYWHKEFGLAYKKLEDFVTLAE
jgi:hypothetical protein